MSRLLVLLLAATATVAEAQTASKNQVCGKQAAESFKKDWGSAPGSFNKTANAWANYQKHYNSRLSKCFYLETTVFSFENEKMSAMSLWDLNENKQYGDYMKGPFSKPLQCYVQTSSCQSEQEWRELIKPFMEE
jgi:hypothetical protein